MANEVKIKLTDAQKEKIREATGKDMPEIRVENFGSNPALSPHVASPKAATRASVKASMRRAAPKASVKASMRKLATKASVKASMRRAATRAATRAQFKG